MRRVDVLVASPGDVSKEREAVSRVFTRWNERNRFAFLHPRMWEFASVPELGAHPQQILDHQLINECELLVAVLWSRLGTPTPTDKSGTLEEIRVFAARKGEGRIMVYFCNRDIPHNIDIAEFQRLREFRDEMKTKGLFAEFATCEQFEGLLYQHLDKKIEDVVDGRLPIPSQEAKKTADGIAAFAGAQHNPQLRRPIDFGTTLQEVSAEFSKRMREFTEIDGGGPNKFLDLGANVYNSCAECLDRLLSRRGRSMDDEDKHGIDRIITRLRQLADTSHEYTKKFAAFWDEGAELAQILETRAKRASAK